MTLAAPWAPAARAGSLDRFYPARFAPGQADSAGARRFTLLPGESVTDADVELIASGGSLEGRILAAVDAGGAPIPLADVVVLARVGLLQARSRSDAEGRFSFPSLPAGPALLRYATDDANSAGRAYAAAESGPWLVRNGLATVADSIVLEPGASLSGRVVSADGGLAIDEVSVDILDAEGTVVTSHPPEAGRFRIGGLSAGTYTARVQPEAGSVYLPEFLGGARDLDGAAFIAAGAGEALELGNVELDLGAVIEGQITRGELRVPYPGAVVRLIERSGDGERTTQADAFGVYSFVGLPAGVYIVFVPTLRKYWPDEVRPEDAREIDLSEGERQGRIDVNGSAGEGCPLPPSSQGWIEGFLDLDFSLLESAVIRAMSETDTVETVVEEAGFYRLGCLPAGDFVVGFFPQGPVRAQYHPKVEDPEDAVRVAVRADTVRSIDFAPEKGVVIEGRVWGDGGAPVPGAKVSILDSAGAIVASAGTGDDGWYRMARIAGGSGIPASTYYVRAESTLVEGPDVTPVLAPSLDVRCEGGAAVLDVRFPTLETWHLSVRRARTAHAFDEGGEAEVLCAEVVSQIDLRQIVDQPPGSGPWWYEMTARVERAVPEGGSFRVRAGPLTCGQERARVPFGIAPNPWNGAGSVHLTWTDGGEDTGVLELCAVTGRRVAAWAPEALPSAEFPGASAVRSLQWRPGDEGGRPLASGVYYLRWLDGAGKSRAAAPWIVLR